MIGGVFEWRRVANWETDTKGWEPLIYTILKKNLIVLQKRQIYNQF